jgi:hypothetical protein
MTTRRSSSSSRKEKDQHRILIDLTTPMHKTLPSNSNATPKEIAKGTLDTLQTLGLDHTSSDNKVKMISSDVSLQQNSTTRTNSVSPHTRTWLYGRELHHLTESICATCFGKRSQELENDPILFCDRYVSLAIQ